MANTSKPLFDIQRVNMYALDIITAQLPQGQCRYIFASKRCARKAAKFYCDLFGVTEYRYKIRQVKFVKLLKRK